MGYTSIFRRKYLVKPGYQLRLALTLFTYVIAYSIILGFIIFYPLYRDLYGAAAIEEEARLSAIVLYLHKRVWIGMFVVAVLAAMHAVLSSHRIVGPIERFEKAIGELSRGNYSVRMRIREKDEMKEMERVLNQLSESLEKRKAFEANAMEGLEARIRSVLSSIEGAGGGAEDAKKRLKEAVEEIERLRKT